jgi:Family of unknown function (DUF6518)
MRREAIALTGLALLAGCALGLATRLTAWLPGDLPFLAKLGAPWLAVAFAIGTRARHAEVGAALGALALITATVAYYALLLAQHAYGQSPLGLWWIAIAVPVGVVFGAAGAAWRLGDPRPGWLAVAALAGALAGEGLLVLLRDHAPSLAAGELVVAAVLPIAMLRLGRERMAAMAVALALAVAGMVAVPVALHSLHAVRTLVNERLPTLPRSD